MEQLRAQLPVATRVENSRGDVADHAPVISSGRACVLPQGGAGQLEAGQRRVGHSAGEVAAAQPVLARERQVPDALGVPTALVLDCHVATEPAALGNQVMCPCLAGEAVVVGLG